MGRVTIRRQLVRIDESGRRRRPDTLAVEEPLEIRLSGRPLSVTMRTPGDDFDLVPGFLHGEGVITAAGDVLAMRYCTDTDDSGATTFNVLDVDPRHRAARAVPGPRLLHDQRVRGVRQDQHRRDQAACPLRRFG